MDNHIEEQKCGEIKNDYFKDLKNKMQNKLKMQPLVIPSANIQKQSDSLSQPNSQNSDKSNQSQNKTSNNPFDQITNMIQTLFKNDNTKQKIPSNFLNDQEDKNIFANDMNDIKIKSLKRLNILGQGSSGIVEKAIDVNTQQIYALKVIPVIKDEQFLKQIKLELQTLKQQTSEHIVKCYGVNIEQNNLIIALEYMNIGSLSDILKKNGKIPEIMIGLISYQVLKGLQYLHKILRVIHRDIKPSNLLINSQGQVKIADFGVSGQILHTNEQKKTWVGTIIYMSPERVKGENYTFDTDIYSLGLIMLECALGYYPFQNIDQKQKQLNFLEQIEYMESYPVTKILDNFSQNFQDFINICMQRVGMRTNTTDLLNHPFIKQYERVSVNSFQKWLECI